MQKFTLLFIGFLLVGCTVPKIVPEASMPGALSIPDACKNIPELEEKELSSNDYVSNQNHTITYWYYMSGGEYFDLQLSTGTVRWCTNVIGHGDANLAQYICNGETPSSSDQIISSGALIPITDKVKATYIIERVQETVQRWIDENPSYNPDWKQTVVKINNCLKDIAEGKQ